MSNMSYRKAKAVALRTIYNESMRKALFEQNVDIENRMIYLTAPTGPGQENLDHHATSLFLKGMSLLESLDEAPISLIFNCPGGSVLNGFSVYDRINTSNCVVDAAVYGEAASMGTIIMQACRHRYLSPNSTLMIHDGNITIANQSVRSSANFTKFTEKVLDRCHAIYESRTGLSKKFWGEKFSHDTFLTAREAIKLKLADGIIPESDWRKKLSS